MLLGIIWFKKMRANRLLSIDALRGGAALAVVLFHATGATAWDSSAQSPKSLWELLLFLLSFGFIGVWLFFVISGFCIHLRWAKAASKGNPASIDFVSFWKRRIRRLYPAYLVAVGLYLSVLVISGQLAITPFFFYDLGMHLAMVHNLDPRTAYTINNVLWTLAIEEQLYLAYFLLVKLRVRFGWLVTLAMCLAVRAGWYALAFGLHRSFGIEVALAESAAGYWFIWALGAVSIEAASGFIRLPLWCFKLRYALGCLLLAAALTFGDRLSDPFGNYHRVFLLVVNPIWGLGFFIIVNRFVSAEARWMLHANVPRFVAGLATVGIFSYSLYLTHELILDQLARILAPWLGWSGPPLFFLLIPVSILFARIFFQLFEKPFLPSSRAVSMEAPSPLIAG